MIKKPNYPWQELDTQLMVMAAHRYCLGRSSYIAGAAIDWLWKYKKHFERNTIRVIVRDTVEFLQQDNELGWRCYDDAWKQLASKLFIEMPEEDKEWVKNSVLHREKDWPLLDIQN